MSFRSLPVVRSRAGDVTRALLLLAAAGLVLILGWGHGQFPQAEATDPDLAFSMGIVGGLAGKVTSMFDNSPVVREDAWPASIVQPRLLLVVRGDYFSIGRPNF